MKKLWDFKKGFSNLQLEGQGWDIIMGVTRLLLLGPFYTIQYQNGPNILTGSVHTDFPSEASWKSFVSTATSQWYTARVLCRVIDVGKDSLSLFSLWLPRYVSAYTIQCMGQGISLKSERNNPWFKPWFNILLHTQSIVCATV